MTREVFVIENNNTNDRGTNNEKISLLGLELTRLNKNILYVLHTEKKIILSSRFYLVCVLYF